MGPWDEKKGQRIIELRLSEPPLGMTYVDIAKIIRAEAKGKRWGSCHPCDITLWQQDAKYTLGGVTFSAMMHAAQAVLDQIDDKRIWQHGEKAAKPGSDIDPAAFRNLTNIWHHRRSQHGVRTPLVDAIMEAEHGFVLPFNPNFAASEDAKPN